MGLAKILETGAGFGAVTAGADYAAMEKWKKEFHAAAIYRIA